MSVFKRAGTWGEGNQYTYITSWGTVNAVWAGFFLTESEISHLGYIKCDLTPDENIWADLTPAKVVKYEENPTQSVYDKIGYGSV